ncbi:MAG: hypothetical protein Q8L48_12905 [Archangium sp.]|nr:hypothetical protein [Archangium sp.]
MATPIVTTSVLLGLLLFFLLRDVQLMKFGAHLPALTAVMAWGPVLAGGLVGARFASRALARARRASWIEEVAREHQVNPRVLEEFFGDWS